MSSLHSLHSMTHSVVHSVSEIHSTSGFDFSDRERSVSSPRSSRNSGPNSGTLNEGSTRRHSAVSAASLVSASSAVTAAIVKPPPPPPTTTQLRVLDPHSPGGCAKAALDATPVTTPFRIPAALLELANLATLQQDQRRASSVFGAGPGGGSSRPQVMRTRGSMSDFAMHAAGIGRYALPATVSALAPPSISGPVIHEHHYSDAPPASAATTASQAESVLNEATGYLSTGTTPDGVEDEGSDDFGVVTAPPPLPVGRPTLRPVHSPLHYEQGQSLAEGYAFAVEGLRSSGGYISATMPRPVHSAAPPPFPPPLP